MTPIDEWGIKQGRVPLDST